MNLVIQENTLKKYKEKFSFDSDEDYLRYAFFLATNSPDPSTQNGAIIINDNGTIIGQGWNTFPEGVEITPERLQDRDVKMNLIEHSERGAIYDAAKKGNSTNGSTMYCCWAACENCARGIICSGIRRLFTHRKMMGKTPERWKASIDTAFQMFNERGVEVLFIDNVSDAPQIRFNSEIWQP